MQPTGLVTIARDGICIHEVLLHADGRSGASRTRVREKRPGSKRTFIAYSVAQGVSRE
jgi:hypothetical protein